MNHSSGDTLLLDPGTPAARQSHDQRHQEDDQENVKQNLGDTSCCGGDAGKAQHGGDNRDNQENQCPIQHAAS